MKNNLATHVHLELWGVEGALLDDPPRLEQVLLAAAAAAKCTVIGSVKHQFTPHGASVVVLVAESHLSIHTWPEHGYAAADILTCGETLPEEGVNSLIALMKPARHEVQRYERGLVQPP
ncbi:MAG: adenosylmethionine decarboxylase [Archangium sp.]|nr:adenosylmethionine decarboxylase [Archangium sp.]MDP3157910.1 adenosylmethionine decarboxylase [Archangium sp.]MDP3571848.1 adenosylmethionine decarboxylase [Archangium sp.]